MKRTQKPAPKIRLSKPLRRFDYQLVQARMDGLLFNVDRHLQRLKGQQRHNQTADRCLSLLDVLLRFARNSYHAVWFLTADTPPDHHRRPNYVLVVPSINRQLLDLLFSLVYMLDDFEARSLRYQRAGWREAREEYQKFKTHFSANPAWKQHFMNLKDNLTMMVSAFGITPEQQQDPSSIQYWRHPGELKDEQTPSRPFLRYLDKWLYADTSAQAHLSFGGLIPVAVFLVADLVGGQAQQFVEERIIQQYRFMHTSRTAIVTLAIATEIDVYLKLGYKGDALYLWRVFCDYVEEAKEMFENRYDQRLASYTTSATP
jgi:hypothetical protein